MQITEVRIDGVQGLANPADRSWFPIPEGALLKYSHTGEIFVLGSKGSYIDPVWQPIPPAAQIVLLPRDSR